MLRVQKFISSLEETQKLLGEPQPHPPPSPWPSQSQSPSLEEPQTHPSPSPSPPLLEEPPSLTDAMSKAWGGAAPPTGCPSAPKAMPLREIQNNSMQTKPSSHRAPASGSTPVGSSHRSGSGFRSPTAPPDPPRARASAPGEPPIDSGDGSVVVGGDGGGGSPDRRGRSSCSSSSSGPVEGLSTECCGAVRRWSSACLAWEGQIKELHAAVDAAAEAVRECAAWHCEAGVAPGWELANSKPFFDNLHRRVACGVTHDHSGGFRFS